ncbi:MAG: glycoside hydrolase family 10 [Chitinophagaceae bacterium]|nr:MAG: glycoside hydrolase family 10 [Chitinophagaceae bacterium]
MKKIASLFIILIHFLVVGAQQTRLDSLWADAGIEKRIADGIEMHRKGDIIFNIPTYKGKSEITIRQINHEFQFGANAFMVKGMESETRNRQYEDSFSRVFNLAAVPFYWQTLEPKRGILRYAANSEKIYRRPPPDVVLEFCRKYNIIPKGHTLVWNNPTHAVPTWMPKDTVEIEKLISKRISEIGEKYGKDITTWDVVNEALHYFPEVAMPSDFVYKSFKAAMKSFPASTKLMINEVTSIWQNNQQEYSPYYMMIQNLLLRECKIDAIGMQFHFFSEMLHQNVSAGTAMTPKQLFAALDLYGRFNKPLHISEITIPTLPYNAEGQLIQSKLTRNFYRLWFSHPSVEAIIWWNLVDGTAVKGEDKWNGGLLNNDFSAKPSYTALNGLINEEWKTRIDTTISGKDNFLFRGFFGDYEVTIKQGKKITKMKLRLSRDVSKSGTVLN